MRISIGTSLAGAGLMDAAEAGKSAADRVSGPASYAGAVKKVAGATVTVINALELSPAESRKYSQIPEENKKLLRNRAAIFEHEGRHFGRRGHGSGFIMDAAGHIVTNDHVIAAEPDEAHPRRSVADALFVSIGRERVWRPAKLVGTDRSTDIAVLKIEMKNPPVAAWGDSGRLEQGDVVLAIGTPRELQLSQTVTMGVVSAVGRSQNGMLAYEDFIQTDAPINGGNSGGPLINTLGEVVGINQSIALGSVTAPGGRNARSPYGDEPLRSEGNIGIGFAVPANLARKVAADLIAHGRVRRGYLGLKIDDHAAPLERTDVSSLLRAASLRVAAVLAGSPAEKAGLKPDDLITSFNKAPVPDSRAFHLAVSLAGPGSRVPIEILRGGKQQTIEVKLEDLAATPYAAIGFDPRGLPCPIIEGVEVVELGSDEVPFLRRGDTILAIRSVLPESPASKAGLRANTVITEVAGVPVRTVQQFAAAAATSARDGHLLVHIKGREIDKDVSIPVKLPAK